ncbi:MAG: hypothetical protein EBX41_03175 [Chitinophagia bacterium]|nr:hypothetical protein [Chitinophagia bacterium]
MKYSYNFSLDDTNRLALTDSAKFFIAPDSQAVLKITYPHFDHNIFKLAEYYTKSMLTKVEEYVNNDIQQEFEYKYDNAQRKISAIEENHITKAHYKKTYEYGKDKPSGDSLITETSYYNNKVEFYTKMYYNKSKQKYKEVRLNDNNKEIVHTETFNYNEKGRLKERVVYFPQFKVTKNFAEDGSLPDNCFTTNLLPTTDPILRQNRVEKLKRFLSTHKFLFNNPVCSSCRYFYGNNTTKIIIKSSQYPNTFQVTLQLYEKL